MSDAQKAGQLRNDVLPAHLLLVIIKAITRWFEARVVFNVWIKWEREDSDASVLDCLSQVFFEKVLPGTTKESSA